MTLFVHTVFHRDLPQASVFKNGESRPVYVPLHIDGDKATLYDIWEKTRHIKKIIRAIAPPNNLVITRYKDHLDYFPEFISRAKVYDPCIPAESDASQEVMVDRINTISQLEQSEWQHLAAKAAYVYHGLQGRGVLMYGHDLVFPQWSMDTYSGRSKNIGFNTQGSTKEDNIRMVNSAVTDLYVQFDWAAADINVAALLSGDDLLKELCHTGDPYEALREHYHGLTRKECKDGLLSAINSMSADYEVISAFPKLRQWILDSKVKLENGGYVETLLGRRFKIQEDRSILAAFNAQMQGTIAHAMHSALSAIWEKYPQYLLTEIHDSIIMVIPFRYLKTISDYVSEVMSRPFSGIVDSNPLFPVRISVGKGWRVWQKWKVVR